MRNRLLLRRFTSESWSGGHNFHGRNGLSGMALGVVGYVDEQSGYAGGQLLLTDVARIAELVWMEGANASGGVGQPGV